MSICLGLFVLALSLCIVFTLVSCKGTWTLNNSAKVNGVKVETHVEYTDGSSVDNNCDEVENAEN